jgi:pimeloyl-ACP methyl ester carboxylesterase
MTRASVLELPGGRRIAHHRTSPSGDGARRPGVVFLGGFVSDMKGTKATWLEAWARATGRAFLRFDYSGHGESSGRIEEGCIGDWTADAADALRHLSEGPQILVGSSMGGWIALLLARAMPERVAGLVGVAAAPDFTEDLMWAAFSEAQRAALLREGRIVIPSAYAAEGYVITRRLIEDGRRHLVLRAPLPLACPVRLLHGTEDSEVPAAVALRLLAHAEAADLRLTLVKGAGHRFNAPHELAMMVRSIEEIVPHAGSSAALRQRRAGHDRAPRGTI